MFWFFVWCLSPKWKGQPGLLSFWIVAAIKIKANWHFKHRVMQWKKHWFSKIKPYFGHFCSYSSHKTWKVSFEKLICMIISLIIIFIATGWNSITYWRLFMQQQACAQQAPHDQQQVISHQIPLHLDHTCQTINSK